MRAQWAAVGGHGCAGDGRAQVRSSQVQGSGPSCVSTQALIGDEHDRSKDWKEAFAQHPDVGADVAALARQAPGQRDSLEVERAGLAGASEEIVQELARLHGEYVDKFGFAFLTCTARGKSADQMLAALKARLPNDPALELKVAAAEQARTHTTHMRKGPAYSVSLPAAPPLAPRRLAEARAVASSGRWHPVASWRRA